MDIGDYLLEGDEHVMALILAQSAAEAGLQSVKIPESQRQANIASAPPKDLLPVNECDIVGFKVDVENRLLEYEVLYCKNKVKIWRRGTSLQGDLWTGRIRRFWDTNASRRDRMWRHHLENAHDSEYYPAPMGRYILAFHILDERNFEFFAQLNDNEADWTVYLGPE